MARVKDRDREAFAVLVDRHLPGIHAFGYRMTQDAQLAADVAQETFLRVWSKARAWTPRRGAFAAWLYGIARNLCIDAGRRRRSDCADADVDAIAAQTAPAEQLAEAGRLRDALRRQLAQLPERQRTALLLCARQGLSQRDAAHVLGVSVAALESLLARGRRALRLALRDYR